MTLQKNANILKNDEQSYYTPGCQVQTTTKSAGYSARAKQKGRRSAPTARTVILWYHVVIVTGSRTLAKSAVTSAEGLRLRVLGSTNRADMTMVSC